MEEVAMLQPVAALERLGSDAAFEVLARAQALSAQGRDIINLGIGQPDFRTPDHVVAAAKQALDDGAHGYTAAAGIPELREAVSRDVSRRSGAPIDPQDVLIGAGGKITMYFAILIFGEPGVEILYPNPGFPTYESVIAFTGATPVPVALRESADFAFDPDEVLAQITPQTRLLIINSPANPTGGVVSRDAFDRLAAGLQAHPQVALLSDEIYAQIIYDGLEHVSLLSYPELRDRVILLDGWSKTYAMTGWRLGYSVWPRSIFPHAERLAINSYSCANAAAQYAGLAALTGPQDDVATMVAAFAQRRDVIVRELNTVPGFRCLKPSGAFYAFPNIADTGYDARTLQHKLLEEAGVATVAGTAFGAMGEDHLRFSYASDVEQLRTAVDRIRDCLA